MLKAENSLTTVNNQCVSQSETIWADTKRLMEIVSQGEVGQFQIAREIGQRGSAFLMRFPDFSRTDYLKAIVQDGERRLSGNTLLNAWITFEVFPEVVCDTENQILSFTAYRDIANSGLSLITKLAIKEDAEKQRWSLKEIREEIRCRLGLRKPLKVAMTIGKIDEMNELFPSLIQSFKHKIDDANPDDRWEITMSITAKALKSE